MATGMRTRATARRAVTAAVRAGGAFAIAAGIVGVGLAGCGGGGTPANAVVVRIGNTAITKTDVEHWTRVIERGGAFGGFRPKPSGSAKRRAIALLISSSWLVGEAALQGVPVPEDAVDEALSERERGDPDFRRRLRETGQTASDVKLELRAELAGETLRELLANRAEEEITPGEVLAFYRQNPALFAADGPPRRRIEPFAKVRPQAWHDLDVRRQREVATRFDAEYVARWTARTTCRSGWLAPGCPQVRGPLGPYEDPFSLRAHPVLREQSPD